VFVAVFWSLGTRAAAAPDAGAKDLHWFGMIYSPRRCRPRIDSDSHFYSAGQLSPLPGDQPVLSAHSVAENWHGLFRLRSATSSSGIQTMIDAGQKPSVNRQFLAYVILTPGEAWFDHRLEFSPRAPNKNEERGHGSVVVHRFHGKFVHRGRQLFHSQSDGSSKLTTSIIIFSSPNHVWCRHPFVIVACFYKGGFLPAITSAAGIASRGACSFAVRRAGGL
jgi:hypothetical protein